MQVSTQELSKFNDIIIRSCVEERTMLDFEILYLANKERIEAIVKNFISEQSPTYEDVLSECILKFYEVFMTYKIGFAHNFSSYYYYTLKRFLVKYLEENNKESIEDLRLYLIYKRFLDSDSQLFCDPEYFLVLSDLYNYLIKHKKGHLRVKRNEKKIYSYLLTNFTSTKQTCEDLNVTSSHIHNVKKRVHLVLRHNLRKNNINLYNL